MGKAPSVVYRTGAAGVGGRMVTVAVPETGGQYLVEWQAVRVDLSGISQTAPVTVAVAVGGQTFTATATPQSGFGRD